MPSGLRASSAWMIVSPSQVDLGAGRGLPGVLLLAEVGQGPQRVVAAVGLDAVLGKPGEVEPGDHEAGEELRWRHLGRRGHVRHHVLHGPRLAQRAGAPLLVGEPVEVVCERSSFRRDRRPHVRHAMTVPPVPPPEWWTVPGCFTLLGPISLPTSRRRECWPCPSKVLRSPCSWTPPDVVPASWSGWPAASVRQSSSWPAPWASRC